jgi:hypothetical protein
MNGGVPFGEKRYTPKGVWTLDHQKLHSQSRLYDFI